MKNLIEWEFRLYVRNLREDISLERKGAEMLLEAAVSWAERHHYGIGGGPGECYKYPLQQAWKLHFGLCITRRKDRIPENKAQELLETLQQYCQEQGWILEGGYGEFEKDV